MTKKDQQLKAIIELAIVEGRIEELKRSKTYLASTTYFRNRLTTLEDKAEKLRDVLEGKNDVQEIKLTFHVPESVFRGRNNEGPQDFVQYLKKEYLLES